MLKDLGFIRPKTTSDWLVLLAMTGLAIANPAGAAKVILSIIKERDKDKKSSKLTDRQVSRAIYDLKKRKIIEFKEEGDKVILILTERGRKRKLKFDLKGIRVKKMTPWDNKWRMLMFDIPEDDKSAREVFREKLKSMGFFQFQKSVWIYPYPCEDEIDFLAEYFHVPQYIQLLTVSIENDSPIRAHFRL